jgi:hypothetical protein
MSSSPPDSAPAATFVCDCEEESRSACGGLPFYAAHNGQIYCVLHYPDKAKGEDFSAALKRKLDEKNFDFHGVWFPDQLDFPKFTFTSHARFASATFAGKANFSEARFGDRANFLRATFEADADFSYAHFDGDADFDTDFRSLADFNYTHFNKEAYFRGAEFHAKANFRSATFATHARFGGGGRFENQSYLDLQFARVEKPELVLFDRLDVRPHWFVNVDSRKFDFIIVTWSYDLPEEVAALKAKDVDPSYHLLATACRRLAVNAEENHRYDEASRFRYMAMEARRLDNPIEDPFGIAPWTLHWWYWLASGYSERAGRAFLVLLSILVLFAALYVGLGYPNWQARVTTEKAAAETPHKEADGWRQWSSALLYSAGVMTLQKPEPRPTTDASQALAVLETILGPVQAALLALAIRRKFMR